MSDVPIRYPRSMRKLMLSLNRTKSTPQRLGLMAKMLSPKNFAPEVNKFKISNTKKNLIKLGSSNCRIFDW
jgi:hypothetical protein